MIEEVQQFWENRPCNIRHSKQLVGSKAYFNEVEERRYRVEPHILEFADSWGWNGKKVLEIGCGIGTDAIRFARNGANVTAIDLSQKSVDICQERFKVFKLPGIIYQGNAEQLSEIIPVKPYDLIYSFGVIHHTPNPAKILDEIKKYCDKNTAIKLMFYSKYSWKGLSFFLQYGWRFGFNYKETIKYFAEAQLGCPIAEVYSEKELRELVKDFEVVKIEKRHIFQYKIEDYKKGILNKTVFFKLVPKFLVKQLEKWLGWHYLVKLRYV